MALNYEALINARFAPMRQAYDRRDTILYALSLGVGSVAPFEPNELKYLYEQDLLALPTQAVTLAAPLAWLAEPSYGISYRMVLHAEQALTMHKALPVEGAVVSEASIDDIYDKGAQGGAIVQVRRQLYDEACGDLLSTMIHTLFMRGDGGFGGRNEPSVAPPPAPDRPCDMTVPLPTSANQALIYRLTGDAHPLHVDPAVARSAGFDRPILHGLCAYGMVGRALIKALCDDEPARLKRLFVRFTKPVFPGEPLHLEIWKTAPGEAAFRLIATDRKAVVEDCGRLDYGQDAVG